MLDDFLSSLFAPDATDAPMSRGFLPSNSPLAGPGGTDASLPPGASPAMFSPGASGGGSMPQPQPRPDLQSILSGAGGVDPMGQDSGALPPNATPAGPASPAQGNGGIFDRIAGLLRTGTIPPTPAATTDGNQSSIMGRLIGMDPRADRQFRSSLAGAFAGGNPAFKGGAFMAGASGGLGGGLKQEKQDQDTDTATTQNDQKQSNFDRTMKDKEQTSAALRNLYQARTQMAATGRPSNAWNKPPNERFKDAQKLIIDKQKSLYQNINPLAPKADRDAQKAAADKALDDFKQQTYRAYGFDGGGNPLPGSNGGPKAETDGGATDTSGALSAAKDAIAQGANADQVKQRLKDNNIDFTDSDLQ